jgi:hypothetical protein
MSREYLRHISFELTKLRIGPRAVLYVQWSEANGEDTTPDCAEALLVLGVAALRNDRIGAAEAYATRVQSFGGLHGSHRAATLLAEVRVRATILGVPSTTKNALSADELLSSVTDGGLAWATNTSASFGGCDDSGVSVIG